MKRFSYFFLILPVLVSLLTWTYREADAQVWEEWVTRYNGPYNGSDKATDIAVDDNCNVYVTGYSHCGETNYDYITIKYNSSGIEEWVSVYNGPADNRDYAQSIAVDSDGNVFVTGYSDGLVGYTNYDYATVKYNSWGEEEWVARYTGIGYDNDYAYDIGLDVAGNAYVTGKTDAVPGGYTNYDYATIKYNSEGIEQWVATYNGLANGHDQARAIVVDESGNAYVTGWGLGPSNSYDWITIMYDSAGVEQWVTRHNSPMNGTDIANSIAIDLEGNVYVTGYTRQSLITYDYATVKYDREGQLLWGRRYDGPSQGHDIAHDIAVDVFGNVYVTGQSEGIATDYDYATVKYDSCGVEQWVVRYQTWGEDIAYSMALDTAGNVYITGRCGVISSYYGDYMTIKYDSEGEEQWLVWYDGPGSGNDESKALAVDAYGNVYVTGFSFGDSLTISDFSTVKYSQTTGVENELSYKSVPNKFTLYPAYPNPFNPFTTILFDLPAAGKVKFLIYNIPGHPVAELVNGWREAGRHQVTFDASELSSGFYIARLQAGDFIASQKMVLVK